MNDEHYEGVSNLSEVGKDFFFGSNLGCASFPGDFTKYFDSVTDECFVNGKDFFLAHFPDRKSICFFEDIFTVNGIRMQNGIISESSYAPSGSIILPPGNFAFGSAYDSNRDIDTGRMRLVVNLEKASEDYGKIYAWYLAFDPLGEGDNTRGLGYVADSLREFIENLEYENAL